MSGHEHEQHHPSPKDGYEHQDVNGMTGVWMSLVLVIFMALTLVFGYEYFNFTVESEKYKAQLAPPSPLLNDVRSREQEILTTYALIDSTKGVYRIPIDKAMQMMIDSVFAKQVQSTTKK